MQTVQYPLLDDVEQKVEQQRQQDQINQDEIIQQGYNQYQIQYSQVQPQEFNQNYAEQPIVQIENNNSQLLKDQNYDLQKYFLCGILGLFEIWSLISITGLGFYCYECDSDIIGIFFVCAVFLVLCLILGKLKKLRNTSISVGLYLASIIVYAIIINTMRYSIYDYWDERDYHHHYYYYYIEMFFIMIGSNFIITMLLIVYILKNEKQLNNKQVMKFLYLIFICNLIGVVINSYWMYLWFAWIQLYYFYMILHVFDKILKGKFELEKNQIFVAVLATYLNILFPMFV